MAKQQLETLLSGIDLPDEDIAEIMPHVERAKQVVADIKRDAPAIKVGFKQIESDVLKTGKAIYDWLGREGTDDL